jgi:Ni/Fe-hydrogenase subunit HybB-like protein
VTVHAPPPGEPLPPPVIEPGHTFGTVTDKIAAIVQTKRTPRGWMFGFVAAFALTMVLFYAIAGVLLRGIGLWGVNQPVGWGFAIINFVWWIGIGHAGTLISAILLLLRQQWRTSINRFAEAMTLFAVLCAAIFPVLHLGRPWLAYWLVPYPNTMALWPQFRSPLVFDVFAVTTYAIVSALFWFIGLVPDMATLRDRARGRAAQIVYGILALGWRGSARHWHHYETAYALLAGLATPLVVSVHTIVSYDFALSQVPGWHSTIFPPYFVAGAIYAGFAMVLTLAIPVRALYGLQDFITMRHIQNMAKVMLATGLLVAYGYVSEIFMAWYAQSPTEAFVIHNRMTGPYAPFFWGLMVCNVIVPQALWSRRVRSNTKLLFGIAIVVNIGMWLERFVIVVTSLHRDYLPSSWGMYEPTGWDWATYLGTIGLFFMLLLLFIRFLPLISIFEVRALLPEAEVHDDDDDDDERKAEPDEPVVEPAPV